MLVWNNYYEYLDSVSTSFNKIKIDSKYSSSQCTVLIQYPSSSYGSNGNYIDFEGRYIKEENVKTYFKDFDNGVYTFKRNVSIFFVIQPEDTILRNNFFIYSEEKVKTKPDSGIGLVPIHSSKKYRQEKHQISYDNCETYEDDGKTRTTTLVAENTCDCSVTERWTVDGTICDAVNKCEKIKLQYRKDCNDSWHDYSPPIYKIGRVIETDSSECGTMEYKEEQLNDFLCKGTTKYYKKGHFVKPKDGTEWEEICVGDETGDIACKKSFHCGYKITYTVPSYKHSCDETTGKMVVQKITKTYRSLMTEDDEQPWTFDETSSSSTIITSSSNITDLSFNQPVSKDCETGTINYDERKPILELSLDTYRDYIDFPYTCSCKNDWIYGGEVTNTLLTGKEFKEQYGGEASLKEKIKPIYVYATDMPRCSDQSFTKARVSVYRRPRTTAVPQPLDVTAYGTEKRYFATSPQSSSNQYYCIDVANGKYQKGTSSTYNVSGGTRVDNYKYVISFNGNSLYIPTDYREEADPTIEVEISNSSIADDDYYVLIKEKNLCTDSLTGYVNFIKLKKGNIRRETDEIYCSNEIGYNNNYMYRKYIRDYYYIGLDCQNHIYKSEPEYSTLGYTTLYECQYDEETKGYTTRVGYAAYTYNGVTRYFECPDRVVTSTVRKSSECGYKEEWYDFDEGCGGTLENAENSYNEYSKYKFQKFHYSVDNGQTWVDTDRVRYGSLVETNSVECGYIPTLYDWKLRCEDLAYDDIQVTTTTYPTSEILRVEGNWTRDGNTFTSNTISDGQKTQEKIYFKTYTNTTQVKIDLKVSSESGYDYAKVYKIDSTSSTILSKTGDGTNNYVTASVTTATSVVGEHFIMIEYSKDSSTSKGYDNAIITVTISGGGGKVTEIDPAYQNCIVCETYNGAPTMYALEYKRVSKDFGKTWEKVIPEQLRTERILKWKDPKCGYTGDIFEYRVSKEECIDGRLIRTIDTWVSSDNGETWSKVENTTRTEDGGSCTK